MLITDAYNNASKMSKYLKIQVLTFTLHGFFHASVILYFSTFKFSNL